MLIIIPCDDITRAVASLGKEARPGRNWIHISFLIICHFQEWWKDNLAALYTVLYAIVFVFLLVMVVILKDCSVVLFYQRWPLIDELSSDSVSRAKNL